MASSPARPLENRSNVVALHPPTVSQPRAARRFNVEGLIAILAVLAAWQAASTVLPPFLFPPLQTIAVTTAKVFADPAALGTIALTYARIFLWLAVTFVLATALGIWAARHPAVDRALVPLIQLKQGIPGICWAIFAIIWFDGMETRIAFVVVISTLPSLFFQARDGFCAIPHALWDMVRALRPSRWAMTTRLVLPAMLPSMLTGLRINLGSAARVTITAELLAGISGIGHQLRTAQEQFRMDNVLAWTVAIVVFVLLTDFGMAKLEKHALRWRRQPEAGR
jgi:NitT/TauT family transport system permease protein